MKTLDSPKGFVICYSAFDAGVRSWNERNTFQVLLARAATERSAIQSFLPERASLCSLTAAENGAEPHIAGLNLNSLGLQRGGIQPLQQHSENMDLSNRLCQQQAPSRDSDDLDKPLFFGNSAVESTAGVINQHEAQFLTRPRVTAVALSETLRYHQRITDGVAARSPGKASSYLYAMKGEARRRKLKCLAPYGIRADPHRESYRFLHRNKQLVQVDHV